MTRTLRTSSYLRHMARQHDSHLPLLTPPRILAQQRGTPTLHEIMVETLLPTQHASPKTGSIPFSQPSLPSSTHYMKERQEGAPPASLPLPEGHVTEDNAPIMSKQPQIEIQLAPAQSVHTSSLTTPGQQTPASRRQQSQMKPLPSPVTPMHASTSTASEALAPMINTRQPQEQTLPFPATLTHTHREALAPTSNTLQPQEQTLPFPTTLTHTHREALATVGNDQQPQQILLAPVLSQRIDGTRISGSAPATHVTSDRPGEAPGTRKTARVTLHPLPPQETAAGGRNSADFLGRENTTRARDPEVQNRPARQEIQPQQATIHIGTIDIHIGPPAPPVPLPPVHGAKAQMRSTSSLSREMTSFIGLRQG